MTSCDSCGKVFAGGSTYRTIEVKIELETAIAPNTKYRETQSGSGGIGTGSNFSYGNITWVGGETRTGSYIDKANVCLDCSAEILAATQKLGKSLK